MTPKTIDSIQIRRFAKMNNHKVIGKLTRHKELEQINKDDNMDRRYHFFP